MAASENLDAFAKQINFLQDNRPYDSQAFAEMFIFGFKDYSRDQAQEIKPLLAEYKKQLSGTWAPIGQMDVEQVEANVEHILNPVAIAPRSPTRVAMTNGNPARPPGGIFPPGRPPWLGQPGTPSQFATHRFPSDRAAETIAETPAPEPLVSSNIITVKDFYPLPLDGLPGDDLSEFKFVDHQMVENRLMLDFEFTTYFTTYFESGGLKSATPKNYAGVAVFDPTSRHWQVAVLPEPLTIENRNIFPHHTTFWRGAVYSSNNGKVQKFDWQGNTWDTNALPVSSNCQLYNLAGKLYVADYNSIQQITDDARGTKLLVSIQHQPPVTSLDSQGALMNLALFTDAQNFVCAAVHNKVFRWDGADWREIGSAPASFQPSVFEGGVLFLTDGWNMRPARISCFDLRSNIVETCLVPPAQQSVQREFTPRPAGADAISKPLWKLPVELTLPNLSASMWQSDLFLMADHSEKQDIVAEERGTRPDGTLETSHVIVGEKFMPKDGYDSALFYFSRGLPAAEKILLKFDDAEGCPPMAGLGSNSQPLIPQIGTTQKLDAFYTGKFLLCGRERWGDVPGSSEPAGFKPGIWVVPLDLVVPTVASLKQTQSDAVFQQKLKADHLAKEAQAKDQQARQAFMLKYDWNHNGVIDPNEEDAAMNDPYYIKYRLDQIHAKKQQS